MNKTDLTDVATRIELGIKALYQLGPNQMGLYGLYRLGLKSGYFERTLASALKRLEKLDPRMEVELYPCLADLPDRQALLGLVGSDTKPLFDEANEIVRRYVRLFGSHLVPLELSLSKSPESWTYYETGLDLVDGKDIKFIWEVGRFGWACKLAYAYHLSLDERYAEAFWVYTEEFLNANPPYRGPHWSSAQEVAIRLIMLSFATQVFVQSPHTTVDRLKAMAKTIAIHAVRIPPTLVYARSQNNNHLILEALGLYTSSAVLPDHPLASTWHALGWKWLNYAFSSQISSAGVYSQHSTNYHRLMLQAALWAFAIRSNSFKDEAIPSGMVDRLEAATDWLWKLIDPETGCVPNLGHNDGSYFLPLTTSPYNDYRPVLYAAAQTFQHKTIIPHGPWEDMPAWLCPPTEDSVTESGLNTWQIAYVQGKKSLHTPYILVNHQNDSWAMLRAEGYRSRPAHSDQLHLDLWWRGLNVAQDPGTFLYNANPPWENSLTHASVHNTVNIDGQDFMLRVGRFLYLDWAQASINTHQPSPQGGWQILSAQHDGYRRLGISHSRMVTACPDGRWEILDLLDGPADPIHTIRLHWLLPNWDCEILDISDGSGAPSYGLRVHSPLGWIQITINFPSPRWNYNPSGFNFLLARAGEVVHGSGMVSPITGWTSPTYGDKIPALACIVEVNQALPIDLKTEWTFPGDIQGMPQPGSE